jgi:acyl-ACP thioesterase
MIPIYRTEKTIQHHECGADAALKLKDMLDYLQDVAGHHADELGVGLNSFGHKMLWVLSRLRVAVDDELTVGTPFTLETYPTGTNLLFAVRQYAMKSGDKTLLRGTSYWLLLDAESFKPLKPLDHLPPLIRDTEDGLQYFRDLGKIQKTEVAERRPYKIGWSDIDEVGHLNNAVYGRFIYDAVGEITGRAPRIREFQINYNHQVLNRETVFCGGARRDDGWIYVDGLSEDGKTCSFQAIVKA